MSKYQMNGINIKGSDSQKKKKYIKGSIRNLNSIENIYNNRISIYNIIG